MFPEHFPVKKKKKKALISLGAITRKLKKIVKKPKLWRNPVKKKIVKKPSLLRTSGRPFWVHLWREECSYSEFKLKLTSRQLQIFSSNHHQSALRDRKSSNVMQSFDLLLELWSQNLCWCAIIMSNVLSFGCSEGQRPCKLSPHWNRNSATETK